METIDLKVLASRPVIPRDVCLGAIKLDSLNRHLKRQSCIREAQAKPLPGESRGAFLNGDIPVMDKVVKRFVPAHFLVLESVNSPLIAMMGEATKEKKSEKEWTAQQEWEVCYVMTHPDLEALYEVATQANGPEQVSKLARKEVGLGWDASLVRFVTLTVMEQLKRHVETKVKIAAQLDGDGQISFFREQKAKA